MEKRTLLAVALSILVLVAFSYFFQPKNVPQPEQAQKAEPKSETAPAKETPSVAPQIPQVPVPVKTTGADITIETDLYKAVFTTNGAVIKSWELKKYKDKNGIALSMLKQPETIPPLSLLFEGAERDFPQRVTYQSNTDSLVLNKDKSKGEVILNYDYQGMRITKHFIFYNDGYNVDLSIETVNSPAYSLAVGTNFGVVEKADRLHRGPVILVDTDRSEFDEKLKETKNFTGNIFWIAQEDKYFTAAIVPRTAVLGATVWKDGTTPEIALKLSPQKQDFVLYAGPKEYDKLKALNLKLEHMVDFGWFTIVAMPLFWVLKFFYKFIGNYGWTIVLITIIVRIPFIPLLHKSQQTMKKMQDIQPQIAEMKERYKKDAQKMQKELMGLYKKHKVNPMGGCLPMLLQIPVFIALYNVLAKAIELRGAPFMWWITDLSVKDPYYIFPVVMGITMVIQQKMTPTTMDPMQAKMMMFMPIVFTFMFLSFPAGLVLYWLVNNLLAIAQQYYANKTMAHS
ncbi:MAG: membrane protein insertase YidC [Nitrospirae bacterium]|nr:membrane protein insertase YidC [Nitrospirota bacterium]